MHSIEAGPPAVLIRPEQADKVQGKNVIISEPHAAPNVQVNSGHKVMLEKDEEGKNKLKITAGSTQFLRRQRWRHSRGRLGQLEQSAKPTPSTSRATRLSYLRVSA
jgi:hypothetical protein